MLTLKSSLASLPRSILSSAVYKNPLVGATNTVGSVCVIGGPYKMTAIDFSVITDMIPLILTLAVLGMIIGMLAKLKF